MRIAIINFDSVINAYSGTAKVFADMANALTAKGHDVFTLAYDLRDGEPGFKFDERVHFTNCCAGIYEKLFHNEGVAKLKTFFISDRKKRRIKRYQYELEAKSHSIAKAIDVAKPDVIITFQHEITYLLMDIIGTKIPVISMIHSTPTYYFDRPEFEDLFKSSLERCACVQVLLPEFIEETKKYLPHQKVVAIPNVVPQYEEKSEFSKREPVIINVAKVSGKKRQDFIVDAFAKLASQYPNWRVDIWGWDQTEFAKQLAEHIKKSNLSSVVSLRGETDNVPEKLRSASIFVFPSVREGFGIALAEAMSMGLPVIACRSCTAARALVQHDVNGLLCEDSVEDLAKTIEFLINHPDVRQRLGENAQISMKRYAPDVIWDQWDQLLRDSVQNHSLT